MSRREIQEQGRLCAMQQPEHHSCTLYRSQPMNALYSNTGIQ